VKADTTFTMGDLLGIDVGTNGMSMATPSR
jgi:hypothetical protein